MSEPWIVVAGVGGATILIKGLGPVLLGGRALPLRVLNVVELLAPAVLAALVVTQTVGGDRELVFDARLVGVAAATVPVLLRAPLLVVIVVGALSTALVRAV
jgi:branched-subunit amino acid transport protein